MRPRGPLLERDAELDTIDAAIASAIDGDGGLVVIEGPAGIGKTTLLDEARRRAADRGLALLWAQGAALEHDFGFGAVRQLFDPVLRRANPSERRQLLSGAAALAAPAVAPSAETGAPPAQEAAVLHGLYWLTANLADQSPVLIVVDDVHWCDASSMRFFAYLAHRLEGMNVALLAAVRSGDPEADAAAVDALRSEPRARALRPAPLTIDGVSRLVADRLGPPEPPFVEACRVATGGVPFLVDELLRTLKVEDVHPTADAASRIAEAGPEAVAHATMQRLSRLPPEATAVVRAAAVFGRQARLDRVATLAVVDIEEARAALESLVTMGILRGGQPIEFVHALVRQAIYDGLQPTRRSDTHRRAAAILIEEHAPVEEAAAHLLLSEPEGRSDVVGTLRAAASEVIARGAAASAVAYLRRALEEGAAAGADRASLVHELGSAEAFALDPRAVEDLADARRLEHDPLARARIGWELAQAHLVSGGWAAAQQLLDEVLEELDGLDHDLEASIEAARVAAEAYDPAQAAGFDARVAQLNSLVDRGGPGTRLLALVLAVMTVYRCGNPETARALIEHGLDDGRLLRDEGSESLALVQAVWALAGLGDLDAVEHATAGVFENAQRRGSVMGYMMGCVYRAVVDTLRGQLLVAESYLRSVFERAIEHGVAFVIPSAVWAGTDVLLERSTVDDLVGLVQSIELEPALLATISGAWILLARGRLRIRDGRRDEGIADLRAGGAIVDRAQIDNPLAALWRSPLALALPPEERDEAGELVAYELDRARVMGMARSEGVALRASGVLEGGDAGIELLHGSLSVLERTDATLERARTLVELGAALRRANRRTAAREPLTQGLDLSQRCGADHLALRAMEELRAAGARPRRGTVTGPDALTSAEARVARMAADGMTNREIAQALFVTAKTVENQLGSVYRKLNVRSRDELGRALSQDSSD